MISDSGSSVQTVLSFAQFFENLHDSSFHNQLLTLEHYILRKMAFSNFYGSLADNMARRLPREIKFQILEGFKIKELLDAVYVSMKFSLET